MLYGIETNQDYKNYLNAVDTVCAHCCYNPDDDVDYCEDCMVRKTCEAMSEAFAEKPLSNISRELATQIANEHINKMNPELWDGNGNAPDTFDQRICTYEIGSDTMELDISFFYEEDNDVEPCWCHYCELREKATGELIQPISGYGIDSILNLVDSILDAVNV